MITFKQGELVRITTGRFLGKTGTFHAYLPWTFGRGPGCDVAIEGEQGPYGYPYVAQAVGDLELIPLDYDEKANTFFQFLDELEAGKYSVHVDEESE